MENTHPFLLKLCLPAAVFAAMAWACTALYAAGIFRFNYPDRDAHRVHGLDVSHHQGSISWGRIPQKGFRFVYIKATEGGDFRDPRFRENWDGSRAAGLAAGGYHYFSLCRDGAAQAENFIQTVPPASGALPPVVDLEFVGNCSKRPERETFLAELDRFSNLITAAYGVRPVVYTTHAFFDAYLKGVDTGPLWIRDVFRRPPGNWALWQYADNARVPGVTGRVDLNVFRGGEAEFQAFLVSSTATQTPPASIKAVAGTSQNVGR